MNCAIRFHANVAIGLDIGTIQEFLQNLSCVRYCLSALIMNRKYFEMND
jgi:hypothetical protein